MEAKNVYSLFENVTDLPLEKQLALLADISQRFASSLNIAETLHNTIQQLLVYMDAEGASIFLLENEGTELVCKECAGPVYIKGLRLQSSHGIVGKTVKSRSCQIVRDVHDDPDFYERVDVNTGFHTRSILCAPLIVQDECIGAIELVNKKGGDLFDDRDKHFLMALASAAALAIHIAKMAVALVEQERMRKELELAREIQLNYLPDAEDADFPVQGMNVPALEVSGDFYDFFRRDDGLIYFNLADVSGKGMNAAMLMAKASSLLHHLAKSIDDPGVLMAKVNDEICESVSRGMFITIVSGFIDIDQGIVKFTNAGHQPPLHHRSNGEFKEIPADAPPIGIIPGTEFPVTTIPLHEGSLYIFTDGVTESLGENNEPLDVDGLIELVNTNSHLTASRRLQDIVAEIRKPDVSQHDDITIMLIECRPDE